MFKVPHANTTLSVTSLELEKICLDNQTEIENWLRCKWQEHKAPFYGSVDLRNSGFKLSPVDMNLYPGGFNNLNQQSISLAVQVVSNVFARLNPFDRRVLLIPENHTRNLAYLKNVYILEQILLQSGIEVVIGLLSAEIAEPTTVELGDGQQMIYHPLVREGKRLKTGSGFDPSFILTNNDLSNGKPDILVDLEQNILPPLNAGWYMRKKTNFFSEYDKVCEEFSELIGIDPWRINAFFDRANGLDFANKLGLEALAVKVDAILAKIKVKYQEYNIQETPYVIVKANNGTYGMGIMIVRSGAEILSINRKSRNKMAVIKDGVSVVDVIIQEGVYTFVEIENKIAEPVVYMMDNFVIGGFYRVHPVKGKDENLNTPGADFVPLTFASPPLIESHASLNYESNRFYIYDVIARLSLLASSYELSKYTACI